MHHPIQGGQHRTVTLVLMHKRLESSAFVWPQVRNGVLRMTPAQFAALFEGLDWRMVRPAPAQRPQSAC